MQLHESPLVLVAAIAIACGDGNGDRSSEAGEAGTQMTSASAGSLGSDSADTGETSSADTSGGSSGGDGSSVTADESGGGALGPVVIYSGAFANAVIPDWDAGAPAPLLFMGRFAADPTWYATLASVEPEGVLGTNVSDEIVVWGFPSAPPVLYEGAFVGGEIPGWSLDDPTPVVMMGRTGGSDTWIATLAAIGPGGELMETVVDEVIVWGWPAGTPGAPALSYDGPVDGVGAVPGWNPDMPDPLVMAGEEDGSDVWRSTLASIAADGVLGENVAARLVVWGW